MNIFFIIAIAITLIISYMLNIRLDSKLLNFEGGGNKRYYSLSTLAENESRIKLAKYICERERGSCEQFFGKYKRHDFRKKLDELFDIVKSNFSRRDLLTEMNKSLMNGLSKSIIFLGKELENMLSIYFEDKNYNLYMNYINKILDENKINSKSFTKLFFGQNRITSFYVNKMLLKFINKLSEKIKSEKIIEILEKVKKNEIIDDYHNYDIIFIVVDKDGNEKNFELMNIIILYVNIMLRTNSHFITQNKCDRVHWDYIMNLYGKLIKELNELSVKLNIPNIGQHNTKFINLYSKISDINNTEQYRNDAFPKFLYNNTSLIDNLATDILQFSFLRKRTYKFFVDNIKKFIVK